MKSFIIVLFIGAATAAQLPSAYVPPSAKSAGGNAQFLQTPTNQYIPPSNQGPYPAARTTKSADADAETLRYDNSPNTGDGSYSYAFETSNGIKMEEQGYNTQQGENSEQIVTGSYSYMGDDGTLYTITYKADGNGFQPQGDHLPTPPPIPEAIQKSLDFIAAEQAKQSLQTKQATQVYLPPNQDSQQGYRY